MLLSADTSAAAAAISSWTWAFSAFMGGRSSRIVAMAWSVSTRTNSPMRHLTAGPRSARAGTLPAQGPGGGYSRWLVFSRPRPRHSPRVLQERLDLRLAVAAMAAQRADGPE